LTKAAGNRGKHIKAAAQTLNKCKNEKRRVQFWPRNGARLDSKTVHLDRSASIERLGFLGIGLPLRSVRSSSITRAPHSLVGPRFIFRSLFLLKSIARTCFQIFLNPKKDMGANQMRPYLNQFAKHLLGKSERVLKHPAGESNEKSTSKSTRKSERRPQN
jgi:hypothetical protein